MTNPQISQEGDQREGWIGSGISLLDVGQRQLSRELKVFSQVSTSNGHYFIGQGMEQAG